jgi:transcription antitermination factor NusG
MPLDTKRSQVVEITPEHDAATRVVTVPASCGSRWHCVWTYPLEEHRALAELTNQRFQAYLPLHLERPGAIVPLFPRYAFVRFNARRDPWGSILHTRGVASLVCSVVGHPTSIPHGVVEDLIARTSPRRIVDDPGSSPFPNPNVRRAHWHNITALSADDRNALLLRLFGA